MEVITKTANDVRVIATIATLERHHVVLDICDLVFCNDAAGMNVVDGVAVFVEELLSVLVLVFPLLDAVALVFEYRASRQPVR